MKGCRALVIEDNPATQELVKYCLEMQGMSVWTASSCQEALALREHCQPDFILSDIKLGDGNGCSLLRQWRVWEVVHGLEPIPAIAFSALTPTKYAPLAYKAGFQAYMQKPFELEELWGTIDSVLSQHQCA